MGMGRLFLQELDENHPKLVCQCCLGSRSRHVTPMAYNREQIGMAQVEGFHISVIFPSLVNVNVPEGRQETLPVQEIVQGDIHTEVIPTSVSEAYCVRCGDHVGWRFECQSGIFPSGSFALIRMRVTQGPRIPLGGEPAAVEGDAAGEDEPVANDDEPGEEDLTAREGDESAEEDETVGERDESAEEDEPVEEGDESAGEGSESTEEDE